MKPILIKLKTRQMTMMQISRMRICFGLYFELICSLMFFNSKPSSDPSSFGVCAFVAMSKANV